MVEERVGPLYPEDVGPNCCRPTGSAFRGQIWLTNQDIVVQATSRSRALVEQLLSGVRLLDRDEAAVPFLQRCTVGYIRSELDAVGLRARIRDKSEIFPFTCNIRPEAYSIVPKGSTVTVSLSR